MTASDGSRPAAAVELPLAEHEDDRRFHDLVAELAALLATSSDEAAEGDGLAELVDGGPIGASRAAAIRTLCRAVVASRAGSLAMRRALYRAQAHQQALRDTIARQESEAAHRARELDEVLRDLAEAQRVARKLAKRHRLSISRLFGSRSARRARAFVYRLDALSGRIALLRTLPVP